MNEDPATGRLRARTYGCGDPGADGEPLGSRELAAIGAVLDAVAAAESLEAMLAAALAAACCALDWTGGAVFLQDARGAPFELACCRGRIADALARHPATAAAWPAQATLAADGVLAVENVSGRTDTPPWLVQSGVRQWVSTAMRFGTDVVGIMCLTREDDGRSLAADAGLLWVIGLGLGLVVGRQRARKGIDDALVEHSARWAALFETGMAIAENVDSENLLEQIVRQCVELLHVQNGGLFLPDPAAGDLVIAVDGRRSRTRSMVGVHVGIGEGVSGRVYATGRPLYVNDYLDWDGRKLLPGTKDPTSAAGAPLIAGDEVIGVLLVVDDTGTRRFNDDDLQTLVLFSQQASVVLDRARARRQAESLLLSDERARLAGELHDGLAQDLAALHLRVELCESLCSEKALGDRAAELRQNLAAVSSGLQIAIRDARATIFALRVPDLNGASLTDALRAVKSRFESQIGVPIEFEVTGAGSDVMPEQEQMTILRLASEALNNVRKHAAATRVVMQIRWEEGGGLQLTIRDDGCGFDPAAVRFAGDTELRYGLLSMYERIESLGGELVVASAPGAGTTVTVRLPQ